MQNLRKMAKQIIDSEYDDQVQLLYVDEEVAGYPFVSHIPVKLWLSDGILAIYSEGSQDTDWEWVSREIYLAYQFHIPFAVLRDQTVNISAIKESLIRAADNSFA